MLTAIRGFFFKTRETSGAYFVEWEVNKMPPARPPPPDTGGKFQMWGSLVGEVKSPSFDLFLWIYVRCDVEVPICMSFPINR